MKLKGIELKGTYKVKFKDKWFEVYKKGNQIYYENSNGFWTKSEYDERDNLTHYEDSDRFWSKREYDERNNIIYYENSDGYWYKSEYDEKGNLIYRENNDGEIIDKRIKELTIKEIEKLLGYRVKIKRRGDKNDDDE